MILNSIIPWGRNLKEYKDMFVLSDDELENASILGCGDGPASFNAEVTALGGRVVSIDPTYQFNATQIASRIDEVALEVMAEVRKNRDDFVWRYISNPEELYIIRMSAMQRFLADFQKGKEEGRYRYEMLPSLSFKDKKFDIALSSHFLFLYTKHLDEEFHKDAICEMLRVANEVRIFPLVTLSGERSSYVDSVIKYFKKQGYTCKITKTDYEFQKGGDEMLSIKQL